MTLAVHPLIPDRWPDLLELFGKGGPYAGCWCMYWRQAGREQWANAGRGNQERLRAIVDDQELQRILRSPTLKPTDGDQPSGDRPTVWSVACFYVKPGMRRHGVGRALLAEAVRYAVEHGAQVVDGYPVDPGGRRVDSASAWTGMLSMFREAGFEEVARRRKTRPVMRYRAVGKGHGGSSVADPAGR